MFSLLEERYLDAFEYKPQGGKELRAIHLSPGSADTSSLNDLQELNNGSILSWAKESQGRPGLRMVVASIDVQKPHQVPFSPEVFRQLCEEFRLPLSYFATLICPTSQRAFSEWYSDKNEKIIFFTTKIVSRKGTVHALGLTYNSSTRLTSAILHGSFDPKEKGGASSSVANRQQIELLIKFLRSEVESSSHPALPLVVAFQFEYEASQLLVNSRHKDMKSIAKSTGQGIFFGTPETDHASLQNFRDIPNILNSLNKLYSKMRSSAEKARFYLQQHEHFLKFIDIVEKLYDDDRWRSQSRQFRQHSEFLATGWEEMYSVLQSNEKYLDLQLKVMENRALHHDNGMLKSMTFLTMLFLPATYVSTLFAIPIFNWEAHQSENILTTYAWLYPAVAIPLTIVTLLFWIGWTNVTHILNAIKSVQGKRSKGERSKQQAQKEASNSPVATSSHSPWNTKLVSRWRHRGNHGMMQNGEVGGKLEP